jgi:GNAT superfamily N-acetyltransferase
LIELERVEAQAVREAVVLGGGRGELVGGAVCVQHPTPMMELNRAIVLGGAVDLDAIASWFDGAGHTVATHDEQVSGELERRGYTRGRAWMKFERDAAPAAHTETDARIEETLDGPLFGELVGGEALGAVAGAPGWRCYLAWVGDEPAATGVVYADGSSAWLGIAFTREQFRGRGIQSALLATRIEAARASGATLLTAETGARLPDQPAASYRNLLRAGFRESFLRDNWNAPA